LGGKSILTSAMCGPDGEYDVVGSKTSKRRRRRASGRAKYNIFEYIERTTTWHSSSGR
jgi:hypothetical protein